MEVRFPQIGVTEIGLEQKRLREVGASQYSTGEMRIIEVRLSQSHACEVPPTEVRTSKVHKDIRVVVAPPIPVIYGLIPQHHELFLVGHRYVYKPVAAILALRGGPLLVVLMIVRALAHSFSSTLRMVRISELRRLLRARGCTFEEGKKHTMVRLGSRSAMMPRHPSKEIATGTLNSIFRDLGLKGKQQ